MAAIMFDSCRIPASISDWNTYRNYNDVGITCAVSSTGGDNNGPSLRVNGEGAAPSDMRSTYYIPYKLHPEHTTAATYGPKLYMGFRVKATSNTVYAGDRYLAFLYSNGDGSPFAGIVVGSDRKLKAASGNTVIGSASTNAVDFTTAHYIEMYFYYHASAGRAVIKVDGTAVVDFTGDTDGAGVSTADRLRLGYLGTSATDYTYFSDIYICDDTGSYNNTYLGEIHSQLLLPNADGGVNDWTASTGDRYACVDEASLSSTDYISSATSGYRQTFTYPDLTSDSISTVLAVQLLPNSKKQTGTTDPRKMKTVVRASSTNYDGSTAYYTAANATLALQYYDHMILESDPAATAAWTESSINASEFGLYHYT
jgi:hypothetical protein